MRALFVFLLFVAAGCTRVEDRIEPTLNYGIQDKYIQSLPSAFPPLTEAEKKEPFGKEMWLGLKFAQELDLYQAITCFKRSLFLMPADQKTRLEQLQYEILLCYYMGRKWDDMKYTFDHSELRYVSPSFPAFHDLLLILYEMYVELKMYAQAQGILNLIQAHYPEEAQTLHLGTAIAKAEIPVIQEYAKVNPAIDTFLKEYTLKKKSVGKAQGLNALIPGAGYLYLGQTQSAITAFLLNGLFIGASVYFFETKNIAAGAIFTGFEAGWYFGGIYGAGLEAKSYNERLYETLSTPLMHKEKLFPGLRITYAF
ncbi:MAG: hypothetical protein RLZZ453_723 [Chlamydiota bacterium]|jgi:TM2 domain-containing membrane protein YozV